MHVMERVLQTRKKRTAQLVFHPYLSRFQSALKAERSLAIPLLISHQICWWDHDLKLALEHEVFPVFRCGSAAPGCDGNVCRVTSACCADCCADGSIASGSRTRAERARNWTRTEAEMTRKLVFLPCVGACVQWECGNTTVALINTTRRARKVSKKGPSFSSRCGNL